MGVIIFRMRKITRQVRGEGGRGGVRVFAKKKKKKNPGIWYEFNDSCCTMVDLETVLSKEVCVCVCVKIELFSFLSFFLFFLL